ncbi:MAG: sugar phosphate isomerase/epimerase [Turicibacter sp.]|nr:sugar phosphate isomerase/epimerase [Turicibacter sp.]
MKLGLVSSILDQSDYQEVINILAEQGLECVELACWPNEQATRRYSGVSHLDVDGLTSKKAQDVLDYAAKKGVEISALAYYPNFLESNLKKRSKCAIHFLKVIDASALLGINLVTTFIGRDQYKTVDENLDLMEGIWTPILRHAENKGVKIAIENCPMLFTKDEWPAGQNIMTTPAIWRKVFERFPSPNLGLNYDPSHFVWQQIDYIKPLYEFKDRIFHVHYKDIKVFPEKLADSGVMAYPLEFMSPKLPGLGDVDWAAYVKALKDIGYSGYTCIEIEDKDFEANYEEIQKSIELSVQYLRQLVPQSIAS